MATLNAVIRAPKRSKDRMYRVSIRINHKSESRYISIPFYAGRDDLNRKLEIRKDSKLFKDLKAIVEVYQKELDRLEPKLPELSIVELKKLIEVNASCNNSKDNSTQTVYSQANALIPSTMPALGGLTPRAIALTPEMMIAPANTIQGNNAPMAYTFVNGMPCLVNVKAPWEDFHLDFIEFGKQIIAQLKKEGEEDNNCNYKVYHEFLNSFSKFLVEERIQEAKIERVKGKIKKISIEINLITSHIVNRYKEWLNERTPGGRNVSRSLSQMSALFNKAKAIYNDDEINQIMIPRNPFAKVKIPPIQPTSKKPLKPEEIIAIAALPDMAYPDYRNDFCLFNLARDMIILSFLLAGINSADLFTCKKIALVDGQYRLVYNRKKSKNRRKKDNALVDTCIPSEEFPLIEKYIDQTNERIFCFHRHYTDHTTFNAAINIGLKRVGAQVGIADLEYYSARRGWANIARYRCGISNDDIDLALGHKLAEHDLARTYTGVEWGPADKANRAVIDYVFHKQAYEKPASESLLAKIVKNKFKDSGVEELHQAPKIKVPKQLRSPHNRTAKEKSQQHSRTGQIQI